MKNETSVKYFYILALSGNPKSKTLISSLLFLIYLVAVLINSAIITVIFMEPHLHHPMYFFICNLSFVDILYTTVTVPKFLYVLWLENNIVSFAECFTQFYFYFAVASTEEMLLFIMGYDRYVAICIPLHYHRILSRKNVILIISGLWVTLYLNAFLFIVAFLNMSTCHSNSIHQFFCDAKSLMRISCTSSTKLYFVIIFEILLFGLCPFLCTLISYTNIFLVILRIKTSDGRRKAFSTCSSHLSVITLYYTSAFLAFLLPVYSDVMDFVFSASYTTFIPLLNPIIYSLQNSGVRQTVKRLFGQRPQIL